MTTFAKSPALKLISVAVKKITASNVLEAIGIRTLNRKLWS